jgi:hypothetical protein
MNTSPFHARNNKGLNHTAVEHVSLEGTASRGEPRYRTLGQPARGETTSRPQPAGRHEERSYFHFQAGQGLACVPYCWNRS